MSTPTIKGIENMSASEIAFEVSRGGRFIMYTYCISALIVTFRRSSDIFLVRSGESAVTKGLPYSATSLLLGWWGFPWGFIYTPQALYKNFKGGTNVTPAILERLNIAPAVAPPPALN